MTIPAEIQSWVDEMAGLCQPDRVQWVTGEPEEQAELFKAMPYAIPLKRPGSYLFRSDPADVARVEDKTYICSKTAEEAGPNNHWEEPGKMKAHLLELFKGCMKGRVMYVIPFSMGPIGSPFSKIGIQLTDSPYVVVNMKLMTRAGTHILDVYDGEFVPCMHSCGTPVKNPNWPCNPEKLTIAHFPETSEIWSYGSGYGGNALLGKKCFALRIASILARDEGWLAEHMLIMALINPEGKRKYFAAAFPSACGKTNLAMMTPSLPGWRVETVGDDIAWLRFKKDGRLYAVNPEAGFFGVAPGTSVKTNPNAMEMIDRDTLFTNVALTDDKDVWWEGMTDAPPAHLINWLGQEWKPGSTERAAHPNSRFTVSVSHCPTMDPKWESPEGVPISAIIFGGRRSHTIPLCYEAYNWEHGVFIGASISSEMTAAAVGNLGELRHDPFAMLPFCGYNMGDYFQHWIKMGLKGRNPPKIFGVNWFRKDAKGNYLWPGFGDNAKVLKWIWDRCEEKIPAVRSPMGYLPRPSDLNAPEEILKVDPKEWEAELKSLRGFFSQFQNKLPQSIINNLNERVTV